MARPQWNKIKHIYGLQKRLESAAKEDARDKTEDLEAPEPVPEPEARKIIHCGSTVLQPVKMESKYIYCVSKNLQSSLALLKFDSFIVVLSTLDPSNVARSESSAMLV